jgi:hypothetical protein
MFDFIKSLFQQRTEIFVCFDGDQTSAEFVKSVLANRKQNIKYLLIHSHLHAPKKLAALGIEMKIAPKFGKESTDNMIAVNVTMECCTNKHLREVHIVSGDGDTIDMCYTLAKEFPNIKFFYNHLGSRKLKKGIGAFVANGPCNLKFACVSSKINHDIS